MTTDKSKKTKTNPFADLTHDAVFKDLANHRKFRIAFLKTYMPKALAKTVDWNSVTLYSMNTEHVRQQDKANLKQKEQSDIAFLFRFRNGEEGMTICHIENQTTEDHTIILRSLHYQTSLLLDYLKTHKTKKLPLIFSIIYYANKRPFPYDHSIYGHFADPELAKRYAFKNIFVDLSLMDDAELSQHEYLSGYELIFKAIRQGRLDGDLSLLARQITVYDQTIRKTLIKYLSRHSDMQPDKFRDILIRSESKLKAEIMTVAEAWEKQGEEKGRLQGIQQGMQEGIQQGKAEIAKNLLAKGLDMDLVADSTGMSMDMLKVLKAQIKN